MNPLTNIKHYSMDILAAGIGTATLALSAVLAPINHYLTALILILCSIFLYFFIACVLAKRNWWDIRATFSVIWLLTIGLTQLRLTDYQKPWADETWLILALAYLMFYVGAVLGNGTGRSLYSFFQTKKDKQKGRIMFELQENRLFWICFGVTLMGLICFIGNIIIKRYVPFWGPVDSYVDFYTKLYPFAIAASMISGLCYYTLKTQKLTLWKKIFLWFSIAYSTFLFPILVVSRGAFLSSALALTTAVFYFNKKKLLSLVICAVITVFFFAVGTNARGYSEYQMNVFFEPSDIIIQKPDTDSVDPNDNTASSTFQLSGTAAFIYSYLTVSHDNFNEAVIHDWDYSYGARQFAPFNTLLRLDAVNEFLSQFKTYKVREHLNVINVIGDAYYDFGIIGVALFMLFWAFVFGILQSFFLAGNGPFSLMALGNAMSPIVLSFFSVWMSLFSFWMHWGFAFILFLIAVIHIKPKHKNILN